MDNTEVWRSFFLEWPTSIPPRGVVVSSFDEQIPFVSFLTTQSVLLLERRAPDSLGGRRVMIPYGNILAVKFVDPLANEVFTTAGFKEPATKN